MSLLSSVVLVLVVLLVVVWWYRKPRKESKDRVDLVFDDLKDFKTQEAITKLNEIVEMPQASDEEKVDSLWTLGTLFQYGDTNIKPNRNAAMEVYRAMLEGDLLMTESKKVDIQERITLLDTHIPWVRNYRVANELERHRDQDPRGLPHQGQPEQTPPKVAKIPKIRDDPQNVHDTTLTKTLAKSINDIKAEVSPYQSQTQGWLEEIENYIETSPMTEKDKAKQIVDVFKKRDGHLSMGNTTELEALKLVWERIKNTHNDDQDLKDTLVRNLADSIENGLPVCVSGTVARMMETLQTVDPKVSIKPQWAVRSEMLSKASQIRNSMISNYSDEEQKVIDALESSKDQEQFVKSFHDRVRETFTQEYVDSGILSREKMEAELKDWLSSVE